MTSNVEGCSPIRCPPLGRCRTQISAPSPCGGVGVLVLIHVQWQPSAFSHAGLTCTPLDAAFLGMHPTSIYDSPCALLGKRGPGASGLSIYDFQGESEGTLNLRKLPMAR